MDLETAREDGSAVQEPQHVTRRGTIEPGTFDPRRRGRPPEARDGVRGPAPGLGGRLIRLGLAGLALVLLAIAGRSLAPVIPAVTTRVQSLGALAPIAFVLFYAVAEVAFVPGSLLTLAAGAVFGVLWGTMLALVGATLGATGAFLVARYGARRRVEKWIRASPRFAALDRALAGEGRKIVFLMRLTPLIPFNALNYALGVTRVRFVDYLIGSIGMLPGTLLYTYYGHVAGDVARLASGAAAPRGTAYYVLLAAGLVATIAVTTILTRAARRTLAASASTASA
jgi:uncharacterized membrane protein YdjX (TVP38/TMEM64 family)